MNRKDLSEGEKRLIDEAFKKVTNGKVRIEDIDRMAAEDNKRMSELVKFTLSKIIDICQTRYGGDEMLGFRPPNKREAIAQISTYVMIFMQMLLDNWNHTHSMATGEDRLKEMKRYMDEKDWRNK